MRWKLLAAVVLSLVTAALHAELSSEDYLGGAAIQDEAERERLRELIDAARQRELLCAQALEHEHAEEQSRRQEQRAAEVASRPPGAVLAETHCGTCHAMDVMETVRHTGLGWSLTIARMRWLNGARIPPGDAAIVRAHLARTQAADIPRAICEYGLIALIALVPGGWVFRRLYRRPSQ
jgi:hypothetical protein